MKIKIIAVGSTKLQRLLRRWGVSFLIGEDVLFDTFGDPAVFARNLRRFRVDATKIRHVIVSHDDWDHIAGLGEVIAGRKEVSVYIWPGFKPEIKEKIAAFGVRLVEVGQLTRIKEGIFSSGQMRADCGTRVVFEQAVVLKFLKSLTIITGCAHPGVIPILEAVQKQFARETVTALIGGFHLKDNPPQMNFQIITALRRAGLRKIVPLHCTGAAAVRMISEMFGRRCVRAREGDTIDI
ncbi:MAG: MBL fold metallo-hydrolase [Candidatus Omnitrophica bacterium]|nr:MBL fold metallo-hydrolase [Candidatus Omnitrophota bacterium]